MTIPEEPSPVSIEVVPDSPYGTPPSRRHQIQVIATLAVIVAAIVAVTVSAVGGSNGKKVTDGHLLQLIHRAAAAVQSEPAARSTMTEKVSAAGHSATITINSLASTANHVSETTITGPGYSQQTRSVNHVAYATVSAANRYLNDGKPWVAVQVSPSLVPKVLRDSNGNFLQALTSVSGGVTTHGPAQVNGVATTEYSMKVNLVKLFGSLYEQMDSSVTASGLNRVGLNAVATNLWLDHNGLPRRLTMSFGLKGISIDADELIVPYQKPVNVSPPPSSEVHRVATLQDFTRVISGGDLGN